MKSLFTILIFGVLLASCKEDNSMGALLESLHVTMLEHDSILKVTHDRLNKKHQEWKTEYKNAKGSSTPDSLHIKLEKAHDILLEKHDDIIDKHEVILRMHKRLIEKYNSGNVDHNFVKEEHQILEEEYKLMQMDHDQLLQDHAQLERDHTEFMSSVVRDHANNNRLRFQKVFNNPESDFVIVIIGYYKIHYSFLAYNMICI